MGGRFPSADFPPTAQPRHHLVEGRNADPGQAPQTRIAAHNHAFFAAPPSTANGFVEGIGGGSDAGFEHSLLLDWSSTVEDDALIGFTGWPTQQMMPVTTPRLHARPRPRLPVQRDCMNGTRGRVGKVADPLRGEGIGTYLPPRPKAAQAAMQPSNPRRNAGRLRLRPMKTRRLCRAASGFQGPM